MKAIIQFLLPVSCCLLSVIANAQKAIPASDTALRYLQHYQRPVVTNDYNAFVRSMKPVLKKMSNYTVIGLGEGTHGTSEFQTIRTYITRYLARENGFNLVCLENSYGWGLALNRYVQTGEGNLDTLMRHNMLGMWQNEETKQLLQWIRQFNQTHSRKIQVAGIDYSCIAPAAITMQSIIHTLRNDGLNVLMDTLITYSNFMDAAYADMNNKQQQYAWKHVLQNGIRGYELVQKIKQVLQALPANTWSGISKADSNTVHTALYNCEMSFYALYRPSKEKQELSRDEVMATMVQRIANTQPASKVLVWAHQAHVARKSAFGYDNNGGGTGYYLERFFPKQYFVLGMGTGGGTVSITHDRFIVTASRFTTAILPEAITGSWEQQLMLPGAKDWYIDCTDKQQLPLLKLRFTGYAEPGADDFVRVRLNELFDGFIFINRTQATLIQQ